MSPTWKAARLRFPAVFFTVAVAFVCQAVGTPPCSAVEDDPVQRVRDTAFVFDSGDKASQSIKIKGRQFLSNGNAISYILVYRKPDSYAMIVFDDARGSQSPLALAAEKKLLLYDPMIASFVLFDDLVPDFTFGVNADRLRYRFLWMHSRGSACRLHVDIKSLLNAPGQPPSVKAVGSGLYEFRCTSTSGMYFEGVADSNNKIFRNILLYDGSGKGPLIAIDLIEINDFNDAEVFKFGGQAALRNKDIQLIKINELAPDKRGKLAAFYLDQEYWLLAAAYRDEIRGRSALSNARAQRPVILGVTPRDPIQVDNDCVRLLREDIITTKRLQILGYKGDRVGGDKARKGAEKRKE